MGDYISRDMAIARLTKVEVTNRLATMTDAKRVIAEMPAADVAPVVHGRETREGGSTMNISEAVDRAVKAKWRADLVNMLTDAGRTLEHANLRANGNVYQDINVGLLLLEAARSLQECQSELEPENPDDVVAKVTVPDRWAMTEAWQRSAMAAAPKPMTNGDRIRAMTDEELAESDELLSGLCNVLHGQGYPCEANTCRESLIKWLGSPEKEAAPEPVTNGDRIQDMKDGELAERERLEKLFAERERLERLFEEARQIADRRAWDETSRTMADSCGQEANDE